MSALRKIALVARFELISTITRRSVLIVMLGLPLVILVVAFVANRLAAPDEAPAGLPGGAAGATSALSELVMGQQSALPSGVVDQSGLLPDLPENGLFVAYARPQSALAAYGHGDILNYYVIPWDVLQTGAVQHYASSLTYPRRDQERAVLFRLLSAGALAEADPNVSLRILQPANFRETDVTASGAPAEPDGGGILGAQFVVGMAVGILFFITTMSASGYLLQSLGKEKQNRVLEVLLASVRPREMLTGKIIGLGIFGLLQLAIWSVVTLLLLGGGNSFFGNLPLPELQIGEWLVIAAFFIGGYFIFASLYAGLGALAPNPKEGSQYAFFIILPALIPLWFNNIFWTAPNGPAAVALSLFPLTAPLSMPMRTVSTNVPAWQVALSLALIFLTGLGIITLVARIFRSQNLLSGQELNLRRIFAAFRQI